MKALLGACAAAVLAACSGGGGGTEETPLYTITANVLGLNGTLVLRNNGGDNLTVSADGSFPFPTTLANGSVYSVTVYSQPTGYTCTLGGNSGFMPPNDISVAVSCSINTLNMLSFVAGDLGGSGNVDGVGTTARFNSALGVAVDGSGNAFVADTFNHTIRKIATDNEVTTFAGVAGSSGNVDGASGTSKFNNPNAVAVDGSGNVYVADTGNNAIRKITAGGMVSTLIANTDMVSGATLSGPQGVAIDASGNIYVGDTNNLRILKIAGTVSVLTTDAYGPVQLATDSTNLYWSAEDVSGGGAGFLRTMPLAGGAASSLSGVSDPVGVAVVGTDVFFTVFALNHAIWKRDSLGNVTVYAGATGTPGDWNDASGTNARFNAPWGLAKDGSGNLYVADSSNNAIRKISTTQVVSTIGGAAAKTGNNDGSGINARFYSPNGLGVDASGVLYVADYANHMIRQVTVAGAVTTFAGIGTAGYSDTAPVKFNFPTDVAVDSSGNAYVADSSNQVIRKVTPTGVVSTFAGTAGMSGFSNTAPVTFSGPQGVALDSTGTTLYVAEVFDNAVRKIAGGTVTTFASGLNTPSRTAVDGAGNVYVADTGNHAIRVITPAGSMSTFAGLVGTSGSADGSGGAAMFSSPHDIAIDASGNLYVADTGNNAIRKITPAGDVTTIAGVAARKGFIAGPPPGALSSPVGVAISGNALYVTMANGVVKIGPLQ